jgi:hypothetical protein
MAWLINISLARLVALWIQTQGQTPLKNHGKQKNINMVPTLKE